MKQTRLISFNIEKAKAGAKVFTRNGNQVRIGFYDAKDDKFPIVAAILSDNGAEDIIQYTKNGTFCINESKHPLDLFIEEEVESKYVTNQELADWLRDYPNEHREYKHSEGDLVFNTFAYQEIHAHEPIQNDILVRRNHGEWKEPLVEIKKE